MPRPPDSALVVARPTRIRLRQWQSEALGKLAASDRADFLAVATPGAGKTTFALAAAVQHLADNPGSRLVVVAPTQHLKGQWADAADSFGVRLDPSWTPAGGVPADVHGIVTTYQQVASCAAGLAGVADGAFVVLDEIHHAGDDLSWGAAVSTAFEGARRRLALSGTPFRSDSAAIPFVDYHLDEARPDFEYGYGEALADRGVVRPVYFPRIGGFMEWVAPDGEVHTATFSDDLATERANQRLRTALSLEGQWLPTVLDQADERLAELRRDVPDAGGLVVATDVAHARGIARLLEKRRAGEVVVATSDDPGASARIEAFGRGEGAWIVAVRMVSEGVDVPRLRVAVHATTTTTELFFRQVVGRVVRWVPGAGPQKAWVFLPDDPRLRRHAAGVAESRRHSLRRRAERASAAAQDAAWDGTDGWDGTEEQLSMFSVIGSVATDTEAGGGDPGRGDGVFGEDPDDPEDRAGAAPRREPAGVELLLVPPPLPTGRQVPGPPRAGRDTVGEDRGGPGAGLGFRARREALREANAELARELVRVTGWGHAQVHRELNRLAGIDNVGTATLAQLERRNDEGRRWLRRS